MRYISIDVETTGLDPTLHSVIEVGAVVENTEFFNPVEALPTFRALIWRDSCVWSLVPIQMHTGIIEVLAKVDPQIIHDGDIQLECGAVITTPERFAKLFDCFIMEHFSQERATVAGKNFNAFDRPFLEQLYPDLPFRHRVLDPAMMFVDWSKDRAPSLPECMERAGLDMDGYHTSLGDARMVIKLLRLGYE